MLPKIKLEVLPAIGAGIYTGCLLVHARGDFLATSTLDLVASSNANELRISILLEGHV